MALLLTDPLLPGALLRDPGLTDLRRDLGSRRPGLRKVRVRRNYGSRPRSTPATNRRGSTDRLRPGSTGQLRAASRRNVWRCLTIASGAGTAAR